MKTSGNTNFKWFTILLCVVTALVAVCYGAGADKVQKSSRNESRKDVDLTPIQWGLFDYNDYVYSARQIDYILNNIKPIEHKIAMFIIPLNYNVSGDFTDFELKGSTNNFSKTLVDGNADEWVKLQFYSQSECADTGRTREETALVSNGNDVGTLDKMYLFVCTSHTHNPLDSRSYTYIRNTSIDWTYKMEWIVVLVDTSCLIRHPQDPNHHEDDWLVDTEERLMWCFHRYKQTNGDIVRETEDGTGTSLWYPVMPVRWYKEMPLWAVEELRRANILQ